MKKIQDLKKGEKFTGIDSDIIYIRRHYDKSLKHYAANELGNANDYIFLPKNVFVKPVN